MEVMTNTVPICCFLLVQCPYQQMFSFSRFLRGYYFPATNIVHCPPPHMEEVHGTIYQIKPGC
jgi:hypothetical protein